MPSKTEKKVMIHKTRHVGFKKFLAISQKGERVVAGANTMKEVAAALRNKKGSFYIVERPKAVRSAIVTAIPKKEFRKRGAWSKYEIF